MAGYVFCFFSLDLTAINFFFNILFNDYWLVLFFGFSIWHFRTTTAVYRYSIRSKYFQDGRFPRWPISKMADQQTRWGNKRKSALFSSLSIFWKQVKLKAVAELFTLKAIATHFYSCLAASLTHWSYSFKNWKSVKKLSMNFLTIMNRLSYLILPMKQRCQSLTDVQAFCAANEGRLNFISCCE